MLTKNTISIVGSVGVPARYGGFETLAEQLCLKLSRDFNITVFCSKKNYLKHEQSPNWKNVKRIFLPFKANGIQSIFYDIISILIGGRKSDIILILGSSGTIILPLVRILFPKTKIIFHPDGIEWRRNKWNALAGAFLKLSTKTGCIFANSIILDNKKLIKYYENYSHKICFISYGGNQFNIKKTPHNNYWLTIARAEKENSLELIADAFLKLKNEKWVLLSNHQETAYGKFLHHKYSRQSNITFLCANYDNQYIGELISGCKGYIHGHSAGGTNPTLTSAMWTGKKIICHDNSFNRKTTENYALYFKHSKDIIKEIKDINPPPEELTHIAQKKYSWEAITRQYKALFEQSD